MFTILLTMIGLIVFIVSVFTVRLVRAFKRFAGLVIIGLIMDVILTVTLIIVALIQGP